MRPNYSEQITPIHTKLAVVEDKLTAVQKSPNEL